MMTVKDIKEAERAIYHMNYLNLVPDDMDLRTGYADRTNYVPDFFDAIAEEKMMYKYAEGKWTLKEVYQHLIDTERIFSYRMFRVGRGDTTPLAGFEQDDYIIPSNCNDKTREELKREYVTTRQNTEVLLAGITDAQLSNIGTASGNPVSPRVAAFMNLGHEQWHIDIMIERYL